MAEIVNGLLLQDQHVLMAHRSAHRSTYANTWSFPGGHVETGETLEQALVRELTEEIGISATSWRFLRRFEAPGTAQSSSAVFHFFVVEHWTGMPKNLGTEHSEIRWVPLLEAREMEKLTFPLYTDLFQDLVQQ